MTARPALVGGQAAWEHDEGHPAGTFTTFDALDVGSRFGPRKVHVFVPRSHDRSDARFPLILLHDGDTSFWPGGVANGTWDVAGTLSSLRGRVREAIAVAVHPVDRDYEYTHVDWAGGRRGSWGGLASHADYLADEIVPFLCQQWRIDPDPRARVIAGSSHGGLAAFWTATRRSEVFGAAACLSPSFFSGLDALGDGRRGRGRLLDAEIVAGAADILADPARRPRLWIDWGGRRDGGAHNAIVEALAAFRGEEMVDLLVRRFGYRLARWPEDPGSADLVVAEAPSHGHDEAAWRERFGWALLALLPVDR
jgi:enterochelin esterase-like enzyme